MSYCYETEKPWLFTDEGQRDLLRVRDHAFKLIAASGAAMMGHLMVAAQCGTNWRQLALVDRLVEIGDLYEIPNIWSSCGQHRLFIRQEAP